MEPSRLNFREDAEKGLRGDSKPGKMSDSEEADMVPRDLQSFIFLEGMRLRLTVN